MISTEIMTNEYSSSPPERFGENGRLFLVDYFKPHAAGVLMSILKQNPPKSFLLLVENKTIAKEYADALSGALGEVAIISSYAELTAVTGVIDESMTAAKSLFGRYKNLIITFSDDGGMPLFNKQIGKSTTKRGSYDSQCIAPFCVSDMLCECGYEFVAVDGIYEMLSLSKDIKEPKPGINDRLFFSGTAYYSVPEKSYKKLENLVTSADKRIIISDIASKGDAVNLYAVLSMLYSEFSTVKVRKMLDDPLFNEGCEKIIMGISYCCNDEGIISECMQNIRYSKGYIPSDIGLMQSLLYDSFNFMSDEEEFLRCAYSIINSDFGKRNPGVESIVELIDGYPEKMVGCIVDMLFNDGIREKIEGEVRKSEFSEFGEKNFKALFNILTEYGVYHYLTGKDNDTKVVRIKRDNSGFEHFVERRAKCMKTDEYCYSVLGNKSDDVYKCVQICRFIDGKDDTLQLESPLLIVVDSRASAIRSMLSEMLGDAYTISEGTDALTIADGKVIAVADIRKVRKTACELMLKSAILFDATADVVSMKIVTNKLMRYGAERVTVLAMYGDMSGHMVDYWQDIVFDGGKCLLFENSEINMKGIQLVSYSEVIERINEVYRLFATIVRAGRAEHVKKFATLFNTLLSDYTLFVTLDNNEIIEDVEYLAKVGYHFEEIFNNSALVCGCGDSVVRKKFYYEATQGKKRTEYVVKSEDERSEVVLFNVCSKRLFRNCNLKENVCADCADGNAMKKNIFNVFADNVKQFFAKTIKYDAKMEAEKMRRRAGETIGSDHEHDDEDYLDAESIRHWREVAEKALKVISAQASADDCPFAVDYNNVVCIREAVYKTYREMIRKYYIVIRNLLDSSTKKAIEGYRVSYNGLDSTLDE